MPHTILVTGANKGIGYEAVKLLSQQKPQSIILLGSRSLENGDDAIAKMKSSIPSHDFSNVHTLVIDVTDPSSLSSAASYIQSTYTTLDALLHNSGISQLDGDDKHPAVFEVNVVGARNTILTFEPLTTPKTGIIAIVGSEAGSWYASELGPTTRAKVLDGSLTWETAEAWMKDWDTFAVGDEAKEEWVALEKGWIGTKYCASKAILNPWVRHYASTHPDIKVALVCPGFCATELNNFMGFRSAEQGGASVAWPVLNEFESGKFYQDGIERKFEEPLPVWAK